MMNSVLYWLLLTMFHRTVYSYQKIGMNTVNTVNTVSNRRKISRWITMSSHDNHFHSNYLANQASVWCGLNGLMYTDGQYNWSSAPISLLPNEFPRKEFHSLQKLQPQLNLLSDRISRDKEFIIEQLSLAATTDIFLQKLLQLYQRIPDEIVTNSIQCGLFRSDYMLNNNGKPLQIEINTIASSFGCLSRKVYELQQFLLTRNTVNNEKEIQKLMKSVELSSHTDSIALKNLMIDNPSIKALANGLAQAYKAVGDNNAIILFIVQPNERNVSSCIHLKDSLLLL